MNCRSFFRPTFRYAAVVAACLAVASSAEAQHQFSESNGVLILRNGQFLEGVIIRHGDSYLVRVAEGSEIRIPVADVRLQSQSLEAAYQQQRDALSPNDLDGRLRLAAWCLRAELPHRAADQLLTVRLFDPKHEGLDAVERRLLAWHMSRSASSMEPQATESSTPATNPYDTSQLDEAIEELPTPAVEMFASRIQPLLSNRCGAAGCHGFGSKQEFQLLRPTNSNTFTRRYTQRNLIAALKQIEKSVPEESPFLRKGTTLHGGEREPRLPEKRQAQNQLLVDWVHAVAGKQAEAAQPGPASATPAAEQPTETNPLIKELLQKRAVEAVMNNQKSEPQLAAPAEDQPANEPPKEDTSIPSFDPAIFNRRYHGRP